MKQTTRRSFIKKTTTAAAGISVFAPFSIGKPGDSPNNKINLAAIGVGGRGSSNLGACDKENIVALCDVDENNAKKSFAKYENARKFKDFRVMMDKMGKEIDAVLVSTPDHTHFCAAMAAMQQGKHVYVEKPLAHNVWELRTLRKAAHKYNVITQMGNQGHATDGIRRIKEWYEAGVLGDVREVFAWFDHPNFGSRYFSKPDRFPPISEEIPETLEWDLWLGPAEKRPFNSCYVPRRWRGWYDFGNGILGDWACHTLDGPFWALDLGMPSVAEADFATQAPQDFVPDQSIIRLEFPARGDKPPVTLIWHDGGLKPEVRPEWGMDKLPNRGMLMIGSKNILMTGGRPNNPKLIPDKAWEEFANNQPEQTIPRVQGGPQREWLAAIKGEGPMPGSNFDYSTRLTEMTLLGVMAQRCQARIEWDAENMKVTNNPDLNNYVKEPVRKGWEYGEEVWKV